LPGARAARLDRAFALVGQAKPEPEKAAWLRALARTAAFARDGGETLPSSVLGHAATAPDRPALIGEDATLTYAELCGRMAQTAGWVREAGVAPGETVAILLPGSAAYVALWLGLTASRAVAALVNTSLSGESLLHALGAAGARHVIVSAGFADRLAAVADRLPAGTRVWAHGPGTLWPRADLVAPAAIEASAGLGDLALYIYTSGTTGLPKAARISHRRVAEWSQWFAGMIDTRPEDRLYNCLPLFHSTGGVSAVGAMLAGGGAVVIRQRFSARRFWDDIAAEECTLFQYIGELCRYLAAAPPHPRERDHRLRLCCGNGLRGDVWEGFQARFGIPRILEFYASTEGNVSLYNVPGRPGAIGHVPGFLAHRFPLALVRCDPDTRALARDAAGLCVPCAPDEAGEALGRIGAVADAGRPFEGYADAGATSEKIARDVFAKGDAWFRTGDLMRRDREGYYYFVERLGQTFRWKGENVATEEVAAALRACQGVRDALVYGVGVPGMEGRAGMAAIVPGALFDPATLHAELAARLPAYACPVFIRLVQTIATTATFKPQAQLLAAEGFDPGRIADPLFVRLGGYVPLDGTLFGEIAAGKKRL
jgi:fatty-acyl-CoA synthase